MPTWPIPQIRELLEPTLQHMGYEIYSLEQAGTGGRTLRVAIDRPEGITIDDCERVSQVVGPLLDQADLVPGARYELEVSSPGAERPLRERRDFDRFVGRHVNIRFRPAEGGGDTVIEGDMISVDDAGIAIRGKRGEVHHLAWSDIVAARLAISF